MTDTPTTDHRRVRVRAYLSYDPATFRELIVHVRPGGTVEEPAHDQLPQYGLQVARRYLIVEVLEELGTEPFTGD